MSRIAEARALLEQGAPLSHPVIVAARREALDAACSQIDVLLGRLAEVPGPSEGHATRRASDQRRYDEILDALIAAQQLRDGFIDVEIVELETDLNRSARDADAATAAFNREMESFQ